jgi:hypothetical protein
MRQHWVLLVGLAACTEPAPPEPMALPDDEPVIDHNHGGTVEDPTLYCIAHADCPSNVCADNVCVRPGQVAYVAEGGAGDLCSQAQPCTSVALGLSTRRDYVKLTGTHDEVAAIDHRAVTIFGDAAVLTGLHVGDGSSVIVRDVELHGVELIATAGSPTLELDQCAVVNGAGIRTEGDALLVVTRTLVAGNTGAGIQAAGPVDITSSVIARNGGVGVEIQSGELAFNTIVDNVGGVACGEGTFPNNLVARNGVETTGPCTFPTSRVQTDLVGLGLAHPDAEPFDYHVTAGSTALDAAGIVAGAAPAVDFDGDPRGAAPDIGADELR